MAESTNPLRYFDSSLEVIRLVVMMCVRYPLSLRNVEDLLFKRGIDICRKTVRLWWSANSNPSRPCIPMRSRPWFRVKASQRSDLELAAVPK